MAFECVKVAVERSSTRSPASRRSTPVPLEPDDGILALEAAAGWARLSARVAPHAGGR